MRDSSPRPDSKESAHSDFPHGLQDLRIGYDALDGSYMYERKRDVTAAGRYAATACEPAPLHFQGRSSSILVLG
jgi:hypothetical protein